VWLARTGKLPILDGTLIRLEVARLPSGAIPKPVWLWYSRINPTVSDVDWLWQAFLRRFDIEHTPTTSNRSKLKLDGRLDYFLTAAAACRHCAEAVSSGE